MLQVTVRRFSCRTVDCPRSIFAESIHDIAPSHARTTSDLTDAHTSIGFAAGGEPGARLAESLGMPTSPDTLLRRVRAAADEPGPPPRYVGIDDWACKKGQRYGTILIDLERQRVIDLLPGRDGEALTEWLRKNPQVQIITRDRWPAYAKAANEAAPQAIQVADRWHLLKNLREAVENLFARFGPEIRAAAAANEETVPAPKSETVPEPTAPEPIPSSDPAPRPSSAQASGREAKRQARRERRQRVRELREQGLSIRAIASTMGMSRKTILDALKDPERPHGRSGRRGPSVLNEFDDDIKAWIAGGETNTADLYRLLKLKGCRASYDAVRRYANRLLGSSGKPGRRSPSTPRPKPAKEVPSARKLSFQFLCPKSKKPNDDKPENDGTKTDDEAKKEPSLLKRMQDAIPGLSAGMQVAGELAAMIRKTLTQPLSDWLAKAVASGVPELVNFATGLKTDEAAVNEALTGKWSNGPVEGQVNRLKAIKRSMYGRAGMDLLRARVVRK